jgi:hypothetical protein
MRRFVLVREVDVSGISGTGVVVWAVEWPDGRVSYRWNTATATTCTADSIEDVHTVHGHNGATQLMWIDSPRAGETWRRYVGIGDTTKTAWRGRSAGAAPQETQP